MDEKTAKTKMCPYCVNLSSLGLIAGIIPLMTSSKNDIAKGVGLVSEALIKEKLSKCVASDCAMWAWDKELEDSGQKTGEDHTVFHNVLSTTNGHCGLIR